MRLTIVACCITSVLAFQPSAPKTNIITTSSRVAFPTKMRRVQKSTMPLHMNFFKDLMGSAFENDPNLSTDKTQDQLEGPNDVEIVSDNLKTDVQKKWLESQAKRRAVADSGGKGAPMNPDLLPNTTWKLSLYLTGVPNFDPSSSLYGSKVNISSRRDSNLAKDSFSIGADVLPEDPSVEFEVTLLEGGKCQVEESAFTTGAMGDWILSDDGRLIRIVMDCAGYQRKVTTRGTIQNVSWSDRESAESKTSAIYEIDAGQIFAEARVGFGAKPGVFVMAQDEGSTATNSPGGVLKVEKSQGVFGITSKMMACGKFSAEMILED
jgi:hypothetical protein